MPTGAHFEVCIHERERIVEVIYPARLTAQAITDYAERLKYAAGQMAGPWRCLIDQRKLGVIPPELTDGIAELNRWAMRHGLVAAARVMKKSAVSELQSIRIMRESGLAGASEIFFDHTEAWAQLMAQPQAGSINERPAESGASESRPPRPRPTDSHAP